MIIDDNLATVFNLDTNIIEGEIVGEVKKAPLVTADQFEPDNDFEYARENIKSLIAQGEDALESIIDIAKSSETPRAFEIVAGLLKQLSDMNHQVIDLHVKKKGLKGKVESEAPKTVTNNSIFVGTTSELNKMINDLTNKG
jgi:predicted nucleotidyltransferase